MNGANTSAFTTAATTQVRDKLIIVALIIFGVLAFCTLWINKEATAVMVGVIGSIVAGLFGIYKGNPSEPVSPTASTTSSIETKSIETVTDKKPDVIVPSPVPVGTGVAPTT